MNTLTRTFAVAALAAAASLAHAGSVPYPGENSMSRFTGEWDALPASVEVARPARVALDAAPYGDNSLNRSHGESAAAFDAAMRASANEPRRARPAQALDVAQTRGRNNPFADAGA